jgi:beta-phosphoglucomutase-like phosphatase (HAD superfamily)
MSTNRAVLWDMDGTLIDSEEFHWKSWDMTLQDEGITITRSNFSRLLGSATTRSFLNGSARQPLLSE